MTPTAEALLDFVKRKHWHLPNCNSVLRNDVTKCDCEYVLMTIQSEARATAEVEIARLRESLESLVRKMAPHSGSCCTFDDDGTVIVTPETCKCGPVERAAHEAIDWYGTTWKRGAHPSGARAALATPAAPVAASVERCGFPECGEAPKALCHWPHVDNTAMCGDRGCHHYQPAEPAPTAGGER